MCQLRWTTEIRLRGELPVPLKSSEISLLQSPELRVETAVVELANVNVTVILGWRGPVGDLPLPKSRWS